MKELLRRCGKQFVCASSNVTPVLHWLRMLSIGILFFDLAGCCHNESLEDKAAESGIPPEVHERLMREDPLYRYWAEGPDYKEDTRRFLERIKRKHLPYELERWARGLLEMHQNDTRVFSVPHQEVPPFVLKLDPPLEPIVVVFPRSYVMVDWGGGFGHWGLFLAEKSPPSNPKLYTVEWEAGIHAYHTVQ